MSVPQTVHLFGFTILLKFSITLSHPSSAATQGSKRMHRKRSDSTEKKLSDIKILECSYSQSFAVSSSNRPFVWLHNDPTEVFNNYSFPNLKGEVRTIHVNDRNICERRNCIKNNGKSPTFKFVSGEERRPSEVQRVSRGWRHALVSRSHLDPKMTGNSGSGAVRAGKRRA